MEADQVSKHLRAAHGYDLAYTVSQHPSVLLSEHDRIHTMLNGVRHAHVDTGPNDPPTLTTEETGEP